MGHLLAEVGDLAADGDNVGVVGGVAIGEVGLLGEEVLEVKLLAGGGTAGFDDASGGDDGSRAEVARLLGEHCFFVAAVLLHAVDLLGGGVELRVEALQHVHVGGVLLGQATGVALLKFGELGILVVEGALGVAELLLE